MWRVVGMALQVVEHLPAVLHRQPHVENDRVGLVLVREREALVAAHRDDALEAALARHLELGPREVRVVLDDQHHAVAVGDLLAVVVDGRLVVEQEHAGSNAGLRSRPASVATVGVGRSAPCARRAAAGRKSVNVEPVAGLRRDVDLAAEQARDLAGDREPEPRAAVAARRRPVGLLERLEDQLQLVVGDPDAGVGDLRT